MNNWEVKKLGEVCDYAKLPNKKNDLPYVGLEDIESNTGKLLGSLEPRSVKSLTFNFTNEHVLYGRLRPYLNKVLLPDFEGHCSTEIFPIKPKDSLKREFLFHWIISSEIVEKINSTWSGATLPRANMNAVLDFEIPVPPLAEQQRIVVILDEAFAAIAQAKENAEKNLQNARELFDSYLQSVFANPGDGWEEIKLGNLCGFVRGPFGGSLKKSIFKPEGFAVYEQQHAIYNQFNKIRYFIDDKKFNEMKRFELNSGDLIMSCSGTMGKVAIVPEDIKKGIINQALLKLTPSKKLINTFLKMWMESENFQDALKAYSQGAAIQNVASVKILKDIKMPVPSIDEQQSIINKLDALSTETKKLENIYRQKINDLDELKKSILQKAFSGELTAKKQVSKPIDIHAGIIAYAYQRHYRKGRIGTFKRVKTEKIIHLAQEILNIELDRKPIKDSFGPNDFQHLIKVEFRADKKGYFKTVKEGYGYTYIPGNQFDDIIEKTKTALDDKFAELTNLIDLLVPMDTQQAELVATVYAAWNNLLIDNQTITDEAIVYEARESWHEAKLKIDRERFFIALSWMKENNLIPKGKGKKVSARPNN